jgi:tyrosyl-tRNA synthetase
MKISRPAKFGGDISIGKYDELEAMYRKGLLHPLDLKNATAEHVEQLISPIREHFEKNKKARELFDFVKKQEVTR